MLTGGLQPPQLQEVARMTTVASLLYASLAWWGFTSAQDRDRLERMVGRLRRCGYHPESAPSFAEMASKADKSLFRSITSNPGHVLSRFLPRVKSTGYNLRPRAHVYELPKKDNHNFMSRVLYSDIYWLYFDSFNLIALCNGPKLRLCQLGP